MYKTLVKIDNPVFFNAPYIQGHYLNTIPVSTVKKSIISDALTGGYQKDKVLLSIAKNAEAVDEFYSTKDKKAPLTLGEFTAFYYRLIDEQCYLVAYNKLNESHIYNNAWVNASFFKTTNLHNDYYFNFDELYLLNITNNLIDKVRNKYDINLVLADELEEQHAYGISDAITSLDQSLEVLQKYATRLFSTNLSILIYNRKRVYLWSLLNKSDMDSKNDAMLHEFLIKSIGVLIQEQEFEIENSALCENYGIYPLADNYIFLHAVHYFNQYESIAVSIQELALTCISLLLMGMDEKSPNLQDISYHQLMDSVIDDHEIESSFIQSSIKSHRQHYPSRFLTSKP